MSKIISIILVTLSAFFWGANFNAGKFLVEHIPPLGAASIRFLLATIIIFIVVFLKENNLLETIRRNAWIYLFLGIIGVAGFNGLFFLGLKYTSPINGSLIMATNPLVTTLLAALILKDPLQRNQSIGMLLSLLGVMLVITNGVWDIFLNLHIATGDWIILAANLCWALYTVLGKAYLNNSKPLTTTAMTMLIGTILLCIVSKNQLSEIAFFDLGWLVYAMLAFMAIFGSVLAYLFWNYGIQHLGASNTSIFFNLVPVFTVMISLIMGNPISTLQVLGGLLVIMGVLLSSNLFKTFFIKHKGI